MISMILRLAAGMIYPWSIWWPPPPRWNRFQKFQQNIKGLTGMMRGVWFWQILRLRACWFKKKFSIMWCRMVTVRALWSSHGWWINGMWMPKSWRSQRSKPLKMAAPNLFRNVGTRPILNGCAISSLGVSRASFGGVTGFRHGMGQMGRFLSRQMQMMLWLRQPNIMARQSNWPVIMMFWTHGFQAVYGRFQRLAGQITRLN